jgi:hypothetical protein
MAGTRLSMNIIVLPSVAVSNGRRPDRMREPSFGEECSHWPKNGVRRTTYLADISA